MMNQTLEKPSLSLLNEKSQYTIRSMKFFSNVSCFSHSEGYLFPKLTVILISSVWNVSLDTFVSILTPRRTFCLVFLIHQRRCVCWESFLRMQFCVVDRFFTVYMSFSRKKPFFVLLMFLSEIKWLEILEGFNQLFFVLFA